MVVNKVKVAILGSGKISCDLLVKIKRSKYLECILMAGQHETSEGLKFAKEKGINTSAESVQAVVESNADVVFDATSASSAKRNQELLKDRFIVDLTPLKELPICVPGVTKASKKGVSMGSCSLQAVMPRLAKLKNLDYVEIVTTIASESAGMGTRENLSEFLLTTAKSIEQLTGARTKVILIINPVLQAMHNTIYYKIKNSDKVNVIQFELEGSDYIDKRFGNLSVMTTNAIKVAETYVQNHNI